MATVVNFIDVTLRGAAARTVNLASAKILLTPSAPAFHVDADGVITPESVTFTATLLDLDASLAFNATGAPLINPTPTSVAVAGADMTGSSVTVIASATVNGQLYTGPCTISKFKDGKDGANGDGADLTPGDLKAILEGQLTTDELDAALRGRIDLIDAPAGTAGSVTARVKAETDARIAAISQQATDNRTYVQQYTYSQQTINDSFSAFGTNIQAAYQGYANGAADGALAAAKSFAQFYSYSKADADSSLTATANQLRSEFQSLNEGAGATVAWVQNYAYSKAQTDSAIASSTQQLSTTVGDHTTTLETQSQSINGLSAQITTKIDNNGYVSGYGLASTPINGVPTSSFIVLADRFAVALPGQAAKFPFVIGTVNGQTVIGLRGDVVLDGTLNIRTAAGYGGDMDATKGATWGANISGQPQDVSNLVKKGTFDDGKVGNWGGGACPIENVVNSGLPYAKNLWINQRDIYEDGNPIPVTPGEILYFAAWLETTLTDFTCCLGVRFDRKDGAIITWTPGAALAGRKGWTYVEGKIVVPAGATIAYPWVQMENNGASYSNQFLRFAGLWIGRHARGATVGAPAGTMVGGTDAGLVASRALNGDSAYNALGGINNAISDKLSQSAGGVIQGPTVMQGNGAIISGNAGFSNGVATGSGTIMTPTGLTVVKNGVPKVAFTANGDISAYELAVFAARIGLLRTADSGGRVEISDNQIRTYADNNALVTVIGRRP